MSRAANKKDDGLTVCINMQRCCTLLAGIVTVERKTVNIDFTCFVSVFAVSSFCVFFAVSCP